MIRPLAARALLLGVALALSFAAPARAFTTVTVTSNASSGAHTLRQAIIDANLDLSPDPVRIIFSIGAGPASIAPTTALPAITRPVVIDGTTQLNFAGVPLIELRGDSMPAGASGLVLSGHSGSTVRGLVLNRFTSDINGNGGFGIEIPAGSNGHLITGNYLGTDATGAVAAANSRGGLSIRGNDVTVGGSTAAERNVIAGNGAFGILMLEGTGSILRGNYFGLNAAGTAALPTGDDLYVFDPAGDLTIGGSVAGQGNVFASNGTAIDIHDAAGIDIRGNLIGTAASGTTLAGAGVTGVALYNVDGATVDDNVIGGFSANAIFLAGGTHDVTVQGNHIGVDASGAVALPLGAAGISVQGLSPAPSDVTIGGTGAGDANVITNCASHGIGLLGDSSELVRITMRGNRITGNGGLGIDLDQDGVSPNDADDSDIGSNGRQNFPVLTSVLATAIDTTVTGTLNSLPNTTYTIDLYTNDVADPSGFGEGATYLGSAIVLIGATGTANFGVVLPTVIAPGTVVSATATDGAGSTSEFSADFTATGAQASTTTSTTVTITFPTTTVSSTTTTTLHCAGTGVARVLCLLDDLPPSSCSAERLPKAVTGGLSAARALLVKAQTAPAKQARRLEKTSAARLKKSGAKLGKAAQHGKVGAPCAGELGGSIQQVRPLIADLLGS